MGNVALQLRKGIIIAVIILCLLVSKVLSAIMAGTLQPNPIDRGTIAFPLKPILRKLFSKRKAVRSKYPLCLRIDMKKNKIIINGRNTIIAPTPPIIPSINSELQKLGGNIVVSQFCRFEMPVSIKSIGICPIVKTA